MACFRPLQCWKGSVNKNGKFPPVFQKPGGFAVEMKVPCGQCVGCRLEYSRQWAMRCMHEASLYNSSCFITLTYDKLHLPENGNLVLSDFQKFMKRLRKKYGDAIRFYHCGEYGETFGRPHYHALLFNHDFSDKVPFSERDGNRTYTSEALSALWPKGFSIIGAVTFESAAYVARYVMKKITGPNSDEHYVNKATGELRPKEYVTMSRGGRGTLGGIGRGWYQKFKSDCFPSDHLFVRGVKVLPPRYYGSLYEQEDPVGFKVIKDARVKRAVRAGVSFVDGVRLDDNDSFRLAVKEEVKLSQIRTLKRSLEE